MNVNKAYQHTYGNTLDGYRLRFWKVAVTGLTAGANNVIPHTFPCGPEPPRQVVYRAQADGGWYEYQEPDATNFYIHVDAAGPTSFIVEAAHPA